MPDVWLNGEFYPADDAHVSIHDAGLLHGLGVFTTMKARNGRVYRLDQHLQRVRRDAEALMIPIAQNDDTLREAVNDLLQRNELQDARLRLTFTYGTSAANGENASKPTALLSSAPLTLYPEEYYEKGMTVRLISDQKLNPYDLQAGHKTLDYVSRLAALRAAARAGCGEALWFNVHNFLESGSISNVFAVKGGTLLTPPTYLDLEDGAIKESCPYPKAATLPGITREAVLDLATKAGIPTLRAGIDVNFLLDADEVFLTNSVMNVMPVTKLEAKDLGGVGPITRQLADALLNDMEAA